jgi:hypothetical protein
MIHRYDSFIVEVHIKFCGVVDSRNKLLMSKTDPEFQKKRGTFFGSNKRGPEFGN